MSAGSRPDETTAPSRVPRNRPGLDALSYRVGTYASFRRAMLERRFSVEVEVDGATFSPLQGWTTRAGDYGTALLEMWAYIADILTFYQERFANEAFLRTAMHDESVLRLVALLGYERTPGKAAQARLAFTVEDAESVRIPKGLRVQSVAGQDGETQVFETVQEASAAPRLNTVRVFPEPFEWNPKAGPLRGATEALLDPSKAATIAAALAPGDPFVMFSIPSEDDEAPPPEEKEVGALRATDEGIWLSWGPAAGPDFPRTSSAFEFVRKLRFFGYNVPNEYLEAKTEGNRIVWEHKFHDPEPSSRNDYVIRKDPDDLYLSLDGVYDDLKPGTRLLLYIPKGFEDSRRYLALLEVSSVGQRQEELYPLSDTVTRIGVKVVKINGTPDMLPPFDRREAVLYELSGLEIVFWTHKYPDANPYGAVVARAGDLSAEELEPGRTIALADGAGNAETTTIRIAEPADYGGAIHTKISLETPLGVALDPGTVVLLGNVGRATHGETISNEILGNGDSSASFQAFVLKNAPVTFVGSSETKNTLEIEVGGVRWHEVDELFGHGAEERNYTTTVDAEGRMTVRFGDGTMGARLPTGTANVVATSYRQGLGKVGNAKKGTLTTPLDLPLGLKSVTNPEDAFGGTDPDPAAEVRKVAPGTVSTVDRIVSLYDFEEAALRYDGVAKALAVRREEAEELVVVLTVAGEAGARISGEARLTLRNDLDRRRNPECRLEVLHHENVPVEVAVRIRVHPDHHKGDVRAAVQDALMGFFAFDNLELGQAIYLSDVYARLAGVEGVTALRVDRLRFKRREENDDAGVGIPEVQGHLHLEPKQLATLADPDATVTIGLGET